MSESRHPTRRTPCDADRHRMSRASSTLWFDLSRGPLSPRLPSLHLLDATDQRRRRCVRQVPRRTNRYAAQCRIHTPIEISAWQETTSGGRESRIESPESRSGGKKKGGRRGRAKEGARIGTANHRVVQFTVHGSQSESGTGIGFLWMLRRRRTEDRERMASNPLCP